MDACPFLSTCYAPAETQGPFYGGSMTPSSSSVPELLTVEEFAARFRVGRSTVFSWIASNKMVQGIHYYKVGKTIRIPWSLDLLSSLSEDSAETVTPPVKYGKNRQTINLDY